ncbi:MAG: hypothetical protein HY507_01335 [Candidatus Zambryskibacteria bacterium]|nr:hypothetical protein [Candidatus Zambryskibacteria bacterium]
MLHIKVKPWVIAMVILGWIVFLVAFAEAQTPVTETPEQKVVRLRAVEIEAREAREKAEAELKKSDTPAMTKARKEIGKEAKRVAERDKKAAEVLQNANVTGCKNVAAEGADIADANLDIVYVSYNAVRSSRFHVMVSVIVTNLGTLPLDLQTSFRGYGPLIKNLCSGGSVTLSFPLNWEDADYVQVPLQAIARTPDGRVATESRIFTLNRWNQQNFRVDNQIWEIHLNIQYQIR